MSDIVIRAEKLSKQYKIGIIQQRTDTLRDQLTKSMKRWFWRTGRPKPEQDTIWALKDVSFEVKQGEVIGIIGSNGAGKSTLLKLLSRIIEPTRGLAAIHGRVASLLEVGTGFHPELTGRENIYLNGAVLGMSRAEINRKFDEIVAFSEVEKFIDTPVKRYSSGMKVRLAFSVAAHLEPEILIIDEVLAVGDVSFQKKCLGRMGDVAKEGRTVLFVSHNIAAVQALCSRAIYLRDGQVVEDAPVNQAVERYLNSVLQKMDAQSLTDRADREGGDQIRFVELEFLEVEAGAQMRTLLSGQDIIVRIHFVCLAQQSIDNVSFAIAFFGINGMHLFSCSSEAFGVLFNVHPGAGTCICRIPKWPLTSGRYIFNLVATRNNTVLDWVKEAGYVDVETGDFYKTGKFPGGSKIGVLIDYQWEPPELGSLDRQMTKVSEQ